MHRLTALLQEAFRLIGSTGGFGGRLIAGKQSQTKFPAAITRSTETPSEADWAKGIFKRSREAEHQWLIPPEA